MADNDFDTGTGSQGTQSGAASDTDAATSGSTAGADQVSLLTSRLNGQTAKVHELLGLRKADAERLAAVERELQAAREGKVGSDEAAKALVAQKDAEIEAFKTAVRVAELKARFPETFSVLGNVAASLTEDVLAASEARYAGGAEPPTPQAHNEGKSSGGTRQAKEETAADIKARLLSMTLPDGWRA